MRGVRLDVPAVLRRPAFLRAVLAGAVLVPTALGFVGGAALAAAEPSGPVDYLKDVKPILVARCLACHGALQAQSGLRLDTAALARRGGDGGPAVVASKIEASPLLARVASADPEQRMPPEGEPLAPAQIDVLKRWIAAGASAPADEQPEPDPRDHWAFRTPVRPAVPIVRNTARVRNPIDAFVVAAHEKHGLTAQPPADKRVLLRRVHLDLTGLPPTSDELAAFLADDSPLAYERVVDRLLESPAYAERWARHWMDVWRYSDWWGLGADVRNSQKHVWHWRDWIVESLAADRGYDSMVRAMLAADEASPEDMQELRATGYLVRQYFKFNRTTWLDETVEHTSKAFLGLTLNCVKCHDHKYDPFPQTDYYKLRAFFEPYQVRTDVVPGEPDLEKDGLPRAYDCHLEAPTWFHPRGNDTQPDKERAFRPGVPALFGPIVPEPEIVPVKLPLEAHRPQVRPFVLRTELAKHDARIAQSQAELATAKKTLAEKEQEAAKTVGGAPVPPAAAASDVEALLEKGPATTGTKDAKPAPDAPAKIDPAKPTVPAAPRDPLEEPRRAVALAERVVATAQALRAAAEASVAADRARYADPPAADAAERIKAAVRTERLAGLAKAQEDLARAELALAKAEPAKRAEVEKTVTAARTALETKEKGLDAPGDAYVSLRGSLKTLESPTETEAERQKPFPATSTGRRTALAKWITDPRNPLTARVAVNHIWSRHVGQPLVATVFDFGRKGAAPTHPELLDWLAAEFVAQDWRMKPLHRLIVLSETYRTSSSSAGASDRTLAADPDNRYLWRMPTVRIEAQVVRDSLLRLAGTLDPKVGGPSVHPVQAEHSLRRSLYFVHSHNDHHRFLETFDDATVRECYRRSESIVPQQALALFNGKQALEASEQVARSLAARRTDLTDDDFAREAFRHVLCVEPTADELTACREALAAWRALTASLPAAEATFRARARLVHALFNHNDFVTRR